MGGDGLGVRTVTRLRRCENQPLGWVVAGEAPVIVTFISKPVTSSSALMGIPAHAASRRD